MKNYNYLFKYIIVGSSSVGKSCLLLQYVEQKFRGVHQVTMGVEFGTHVVNINENIIKLHIWDTAGQESFSSMIKAYYRNSIGCILVFDITDRKTFEALQRWHHEVMNCSGNDIQIIVIGNKNDLEVLLILWQSRREVFPDEGKQMADKLGGLYIETSALNGQNVNAAFDRLTTRILEQIHQGKIDIQDDVQNLSIKIYGVKVGDFERRRHSEISQSTQKKLFVQISYPIEQKQCC